MSKPQLSQQGFTLIELLISVAIVGLLATVTVPKYNKWKLKAIRTEGYNKGAMLAGVLNTFYMQYGVYASCFGSMGFDAGGGYYGISTKAQFLDTAVPTRNAIARGKGAICPDNVSGALVQGIAAFPATRTYGGCEGALTAANWGWIESQRYAIQDNPNYMILGQPRPGCVDDWFSVVLRQNGDPASGVYVMPPWQWYGATQGPAGDDL